MKENGIVVDATAVFDEVRDADKIVAEIRGGARPRLIDIDKFFKSLDDAEAISNQKPGLEREARAVIAQTIRTLCEMEWHKQRGRMDAFWAKASEALEDPR